MVDVLRRYRFSVQHCPKVGPETTLKYPRCDEYRLTTFVSAQHVMQVCREQGKPVGTPLYGLWPALGRWVVVVVYLYLQPVILHQHLIPFVFYVGLINAYSVGLIIIAHLTQNSTFPIANVLTWPLILATLDSLGPVLGLWPSVLGFGTYQIAFVFMCMGSAVGVYGSFVVRDPRLSIACADFYSTTSSPPFAITWIYGV